MPRDSNGLYTLPAGNPVAAGTVIEVAWANPTLEDLRLAMTDSLDRFGRGGMSAPLAAVDGASATPAFTWSNELNSGLYLDGANDLRFAVGGADVTRWTDSGFEIWNGTSWNSVTPLSVEDGTADGQMIIWNDTAGGYDSTGDITVTAAGNIVATGTVTALSYSGDGSALTGIVSANGVPVGGTTGQVLVKDSNADFDSSWAAPGAAPVDSVFSRTGVVTAEVGDYSAFYLGINATATDSALLGGNDAAHYHDASNLDAGRVPNAQLSASYDIDITGTAASVTLAADSSKLNGQSATFYQTADNINSGVLPLARMSGTYPCNVSGSSATAATATTATNCTRSISAGSGLTGGGTLTANRTLNVDSTVIRTTGNQTLGGTKSFSSNILSAGINVTGGSGLGIVQTALAGASTRYVKVTTAGGFVGADTVLASDVEIAPGEMLTDTIAALKAQIIALGGTI